MNERPDCDCRGSGWVLDANGDATRCEKHGPPAPTGAYDARRPLSPADRVARDGREQDERRFR